MKQPAAARRLEQVQQPVIPVMGELIRQTPGTLSLGQGMVSWGPPEQVHQAVAAALQQHDPGLDRYGPVAGSEALREALGVWLQREQG
jgi:aspartate/methionine/tyrosine aminotransferase